MTRDEHDRAADTGPADNADAVALEQRRLQQQDRKDAAKTQHAGGEEGKGAVQAGAREHPA